MLCDECGVEFAVAYMNHDQKFYCNTHMYIQAQLLLEEDWDANDISYKEFEGHRNGAIFEHLHYYPDTTWLTYIYSKSIDRTRKLSAEEEQAEREKMLMKDEAASERKRKEREAKCHECNEEMADVRCVECVRQFCYSCASSLHTVDEVDGDGNSMAVHTMDVIPQEGVLMLPGIGSGKGGPSSSASTSRDKKKKKKKDKDKDKRKDKDKGPVQLSKFMSEQEGGHRSVISGEKIKMKVKKSKKDKMLASNRHDLLKYLNSSYD